jgi:hypothetical protein
MTARTLSLIALALSLAACDGLMKSGPDAKEQQKRAAANSEAEFEAQIMTGRVEVMQDQTTRGLQLLGANVPAAPELPTDRDIYRRLYNTVERYNTLNRAACAGRVATGSLCGQPPFLPLWYAGRARPDVSPPGLKKMAEEMQTQMIPLWDAVCAKAKTKSGDEHFCAIE